jgi:LAO/AO transport system kinase
MIQKDERREALLRRIKRRNLGLEDYLRGIRSGDRMVLSRAITLLESKREEDRLLAGELLRQLPTLEKSTQRIGISGSPGVGKSTLLEKLGLYYHSLGKKVAILTIDPSSSISGGSILGDKTRMEHLSRCEGVYIRPTASGHALGGVADTTRETIQLLEAAGFEVVLVETVGVGQSEIAVRSMTDLFVLVLLPGAGDELQGIKKGIVEIADMILVNKSDIGDKSLVKNSVREYKNALHILQRREDHWEPPVIACSALGDLQKDGVIKAIEAYFEHLKDKKLLFERRKSQTLAHLKESVQTKLDYFLHYDPSFRKCFADLNDKINLGMISRQEALDILFFKLSNKISRHEK